jgi:hypothetical protein
MPSSNPSMPDFYLIGVFVNQFETQAEQKMDIKGHTAPILGAIKYRAIEPWFLA